MWHPYPLPNLTYLLQKVRLWSICKRGNVFFFYSLPTLNEYVNSFAKDPALGSAPVDEDESAMPKKESRKLMATFNDQASFS